MTPPASPRSCYTPWGLSPALGGLRQRQWNPTHWGVSHFRPGIRTGSAPRAERPAGCSGRGAPRNPGTVPAGPGPRNLRSAPPRPLSGPRSSPAKGSGAAGPGRPLRLAPAPARSTRAAQRPPLAGAARQLTQKMRLRKTSTVLEEVMPHWPMVRAAGGGPAGRAERRSERAGNGGGGGGSAENCWA